MRKRTIISVLFLVVAIFSAQAGAQEADEFLNGISRLSPTKLGALPPFLSGHTGIHDSSVKAAQSHAQFMFVNRMVKLTSSYQERRLALDPLSGDNLRRPVYSLHGAIDLFGNLLQSEAEFAYNALDANTAVVLGRETAAMSRLALKGDWLGYRYGAEHRSVDNGFMHFKGGAAGRSEDVSLLWGETNFGPVRVRATLSQLSEKRNEFATTPRLTRSSSLSLNHKKGNWETALLSGYSYRTDRFDSGSAAEAFANELRLVWQPVTELRIIPMARFAAERNRTTGIDSANPSAGLALTFNTRGNVFNFVASASHNWAQTSDGLTNRRDLNTTAKLIWNFGDALNGRKTLTYEIAYNQSRDLIARENSNSGWAVKVSLTVYKF